MCRIFWSIFCDFCQKSPIWAPNKIRLGPKKWEKSDLGPQTKFALAIMSFKTLKRYKFWPRAFLRGYSTKLHWGLNFEVSRVNLRGDSTKLHWELFLKPGFLEIGLFDRFFAIFGKKNLSWLLARFDCGLSTARFGPKSGFWGVEKCSGAILYWGRVNLRGGKFIPFETLKRHNENLPVTACNYRGSNFRKNVFLTRLWEVYEAYDEPIPVKWCLYDEPMKGGSGKV